MNHRHLLPQELDLLIDADGGFGVAPLRAHVEECDDCRARVDALRAVALDLDALPRFAPRVGFADRVLTQVQVIEPWYVALGETVRRAIPTSTPMRALAALGAGAAALTISGSAVWLAFRVDLAAWSYQVLTDRTREAVVAGAGSVLRAVLGGAPASGITTGTLALGVVLLALTSVGAVAGFRRLAATANAKRS